MGFMDKLKNIFFEEEEEEEVEEVVAPKKEKLIEKLKKENKEKEPKKEKLTEVIAKKIELPKKDKKSEEIAAELAEKFEDKKVEIPKEEQKNEEKVMPKRETKINTELIFDDDDFILETKPKEKKEEKVSRSNPSLYKTREEKFEYKKEEVKKEEIKIETPKAKVVYQSKVEEKSKVFKPSPIISPIYGILDKNYRKEEVKENTEIRLSTRPSRMDLDSVRNKAFGDLEYDLFGNEPEEEKEEVEVEEKHENRDIKNAISEDDDKPSIDRVTLGEADEYYNDLGLAYNTDYKDLSKDVNDGKVKEKKKNDKLEDNLFDLIESMYDKEE